MTRKMKDSGIEWIGEIPEEWKTTKVKRLFRVVNGSTPKSNKTEFWDGDIVWITPADMSQGITEIYSSNRKITLKGLDSCGATLIPKNSIIVSSRAPIGQVCIAGIDLCTNQGCKSLVKISESNNEYYYYFILIQTDIFNMLGRGTTFLELSSYDLANYNIPLPNLKEQTLIATYLDQKCSKIDETIEKQKQVIEKLKEYKQSVITEAVTKGLNPNVKMKDSGVEWIGEIPEHWEVVCLKYIASDEPYSIVDGPFGSDMKNEEYVETGVPIIQLNNIGEGIHKLNNLKYITEEKANQLKSHTIYSGEIVIAKMMPAGRAAIVSDEYKKYIVSSDSIRLKLNDRNNYKFIMYCLNAYARNEAEIQSTGSTRVRINLSIVRNLHIAIPLLEEQKQIANYLDDKCSKVDKVITQKESLIGKLTEYKKSLIYECVTGKREV